MALSSASPCGPVTLPRLSAIFACLCILYLVRDIWLLPTTTPTATAVYGVHQTQSTDTISSVTALPIPEEVLDQGRPHVEDCLEAPGADKVMIVLKVWSYLSSLPPFSFFFCAELTNLSRLVQPRYTTSCQLNSSHYSAALRTTSSSPTWPRPFPTILYMTPSRLFAKATSKTTRTLSFTASCRNTTKKARILAS